MFSPIEFLVWLWGDLMRWLESPHRAAMAGSGNQHFDGRELMVYEHVDRRFVETLVVAVIFLPMMLWFLSLGFQAVWGFWSLQYA